MKNGYAPKWDASDYHKSSSEQQKWAREVIERLNLKGDEAVLDIGCGDGKVTAELASKLPRGTVLGIDSSPEMIGFASSAFPINEFPNLNFREGDARKLIFGGIFNLVVSFSCLHWILDHKPVLRGIYNSLKAGGRIFLHFGGKNNAGDVVASVEKVTGMKKWRDYFVGFEFPYGFYSQDEYRPWLTDTGFRNIRMELLAKDMVHRGEDGFKAWFRTTWLPYTQKVPEKLKDEFINECVAGYLRRSPIDGAGLVHTAMTRLEIEADKPVLPGGNAIET